MRSNIKKAKGDRFGRLTLLRLSRNENGEVVWVCKCDCGKTKIVKSRRLTCSVKPTRSCGCIRIDMFINRNTTHNLYKHPLYVVWEGMKSRCYNKNHSKYKNYGARGIKVCKKWHRFQKFYNDVKDGYEKGLTLDRPNVNGDYKPSNFRWSTQKVQGRNRTNNKHITCRGETKVLAEWGEVSPVKSSVILNRLRSGWNSEDAIFKPNQRLINKIK